MVQDDQSSNSYSIEEYGADYFGQQGSSGLHDESTNIDEETRRASLVRTITAIEANEYQQKFDSISREISRQITNKEGEFQLKLEEFNLVKILANFVYFAKKQGINLRKSGVTFKDLSVFGVDDSVAVVPTVLDVLKGPVYGIQELIRKIKTPKREILKSFNGLAKPGDMVLVLGRPGAGCTTF